MAASGDSGEQPFDRLDAGAAPFERSGAIALRPAIGIDVPGREVANVEVIDVADFAAKHGRSRQRRERWRRRNTLRSDRGRRRSSGPAAASASKSPPMPQHKSAIGPCRRPANRRALYAATHWSVACSRPSRVKNISAARANFAAARSRSSDLFQQQVRPSSRKLLPQPRRRRVERLVATGKVGEHRRRLGAGQPFVIGKFGSNWSSST